MVLPNPNKSLTNSSLSWSYNLNLDLFTGKIKIAISSQGQKGLRLLQAEAKAFLDTVSNLAIPVLKPPLFPGQSLGTVN